MEKTVYPRLRETLYREVLPNGLTVLVVPRRGFTKKIAYFVTDYGAIHREFTMDGQSYVTPAGVAHYLEHKLFDMPGGRDINQEFAALGANPNAFTSYDMTAYYFSCTENFYENLGLLLEYVSTPYFTEASVQKEQGIIAQEIGMHLDAPESQVFENLAGILYRSHPITDPILGTRDSIARITPQVLYACHKAFYRMENMLLCVVGDVEPQKVAAMAQEMLPHSPGPQVTDVRQWPEEMSPLRQEIARQMPISMTTFQLGFKCEPLGRGEAAIRQEIIGDLAAEALFGESSRLYLQMYESGLIDGTFGGGFETIEGMAMLTAYGDSEDPRAVRDAILQGARELCAQGIGREAFLRMKRSDIGRRIGDLDSFNSVCFRVCAYHLSGFDYFRFPEIYEAVEEQEVLEFISRVVTEDRAGLSVITPVQEE